MVSNQTADDVSLIWERAEPVARGGTSAVSRDHITQAAFEIADREGLHAVSVKRVASRLRIPAVRLDTYLSSREDLLDLMLDGAFAEIDPIHEGDDWRSRLRAMAHATQQTARRHPWLRALAGTRTPCGPNGLRHSERALAALEGLGLDAATMTQAVNTVLAYVYGYVQLEMLEPSRKLDEAVDLERRTHTARYLIEQMGTGEYPTLARVFADASNLTAADAFESGLDYVLDGIAAQVNPSAGGGAHDGGIVGDETPSSAPDTETAEATSGDETDQPIEQASTDGEPTAARRLGRRRAGR
jgi:AcrR family transcriptional regulator